NDRMKMEITKIDARLLGNAGSPGSAAGEFPVGGARPRLKEWIRADQGLIRGEGKLDYDLRAFRLTPDRIPRLFVRARWSLAGSAVFLMTAWFRAEPPGAETASEQLKAASRTAPLRSGLLKDVSLKHGAVVSESLSADAHATLLSADISW